MNELKRGALEFARMFDPPVMDHCQGYALVSDAVMHEAIGAPPSVVIRK